MTAEASSLINPELANNFKGTAKPSDINYQDLPERVKAHPLTASAGAEQSLWTLY